MPQRRMFRPVSGRLADKDRRARHGRENRVAQGGSRPVRALVGSSSAWLISPTFSVPRPSLTSKRIGARSTETTSPTSFASSATGPPSLPRIQIEQRFLLRLRGALVEIQRDTEIAVQHIAGDVRDDGDRAAADIEPVDRAPVESDKREPMSQVPLSGSSPIQHGHSTRQSHTSSRRPSRWYAIGASRCFSSRNTD